MPLHALSLRLEKKAFVEGFYRRPSLMRRGNLKHDATGPDEFCSLFGLFDLFGCVPVASSKEEPSDCGPVQQVEKDDAREPHCVKMASNGRLHGLLTEEAQYSRRGEAWAERHGRSVARMSKLHGLHGLLRADDKIRRACDVLLLSGSRCSALERSWEELWVLMRPFFEPLMIGERQFVVRPRVAGSVSRRTALLDSDVDLSLIHI